jgi:hypothetical protein
MSYSARDLEEFFDGYVEAAFFSIDDGSDESGGEPLDANYTPEDLSEETLDDMVADCKKFLDRAGDLLEQEPTKEMNKAGADFWFARNGHGIDFSDHWPQEIADPLSKLAHKFGGVDLYVGDDGRIYSS